MTRFIEGQLRLQINAAKSAVAVTRHSTAEWLAQQFVEAFPWETAPTYLVRDNDGAYGPIPAAGSGDGDPRPTNLTALALAERICRTANWYAAARLP